MKKVLITIFLGTIFITSKAQETNWQQIFYTKDKKVFIENKGQWHQDVLFLCRLQGADIWITKNGINYTFYQIKPNPNISTKRITHLPPEKLRYKEREDAILVGHRVLLRYQNSNPNPLYEGKQKQKGCHHYFIGNDPNKHVQFVGLYKEVIVKEVYKGIDIKYYFDERNSLRFDYLVHPGADLSQIEFTLEGANQVFQKAGKMVFATCFGNVIIQEPRVDFHGKSVLAQFEKQQNNWKVVFRRSDGAKESTSDSLIYSTFLGGTDMDFGFDIAVDDSGNAYITGYTLSANYDITPGTFQTQYKGFYDAFVTKLNSTGKSLIYSTFLGGQSDNDYSYAIAIDKSQNVYITGWTQGADYPITLGSFQTVLQGPYDVFVTKLNATGSSLIYSTFLGGTKGDAAYGIAVDDSGFVYITGMTLSEDYDLTPGAYQTTKEENWDVFVTKLNSTGDGLIYSTLLGGNGVDYGWDIAIDGSGNAYITGRTMSTNFDITAGAYQKEYGGGVFDAFITKLNATGTDLIYSTYLGGSGNEEGYSIAIDQYGKTYITGFTNSSDFDITPAAYQSMKAEGKDAFVTKLNETGSELVFSTYLGGNGSDQGYGITVDANGNVYVTGTTNSTDFDTTSGAFQTTKAGFYDVFLTKFNRNGNILVYSTYLGGMASEDGYAIALDGNENVYIMGYTWSIDFIATSGAYQTVYGGGYGDVFISKFILPVPTSIEPGQTESLSFVIIPNPNKGNFMIHANKPTEFELLDISGKILKTYQIRTKIFKVNEHLPSGIYFIRDKEDGVTRKIIVQ